MELPEMITRLPVADLPYPSTAVKTHVLPSPHGQLVFFEISCRMRKSHLTATRRNGVPCSKATWN